MNSIPISPLAKLIPVQSLDQCGICLDTMENTHAIGHEKGGDLHPIHSDCLKKWLYKHDGCPSCHIKLDKESIFNWSDKAIRVIEKYKKPVYEGLKLGTILSLGPLSAAITEKFLHLKILEGGFIPTLIIYTGLLGGMVKIDALSINLEKNNPKIATTLKLAGFAGICLIDHFVKPSISAPLLLGIGAGIGLIRKIYKNTFV